MHCIGFEFCDFPKFSLSCILRIPLVAICVGLAIKKQMRAGIVYNPITKELFSAQTGRGAFLNGFPIHVSSTKGRFCRHYICASENCSSFEISFCVGYKKNYCRICSYFTWLHAFSIRFYCLLVEKIAHCFPSPAHGLSGLPHRIVYAALLRISVAYL